MSDSKLRGPTLTYVTDEELDRAGQEKILNDFIARTGAYSLRVAFRLPTWTDTDLQRLLDWYLNRVETLGVQRHLEPPLVHDRPELTHSCENLQLWLPWRNRDLIGMEDIGRAAISVHSVKKAHDAISVGAGELIFGHVFSSESHPGEPGRGGQALLDVAEAIQIYANPPRLTAIGGIDEHTIPEIGRIGHESIATMRAISRSTDVSNTIDRIHSGWIAARINADLDENQRTPFGNPSSLFF